MIFDPLPWHKLSQILDPALKVCHTSEQKVNKQQADTAPYTINSICKVNGKVQLLMNVTETKISEIIF